MAPNACALDQIRQQREHRRRVALGGRRLADRQAHLALRMGHACQAVDQHQHILALVPKILGDHMRQVRGLEPQHRRHIGGRCDHHRFRQTLGAQRLADKSLHLAPALANQADHHHIGLGEARQHAQQHALAHARAGHQSDALSAPKGQQPVDGTNAHVQYPVDRSALHRVERQPQQAQSRGACRPGLAVQRVAAAVNHPPQQFRAQTRVAVVGQQAHGGARPDAVGLRKWHQKKRLVAKAHHFGLNALAVGCDHLAAGPHRRHDAARLQPQTDQAHQGSAARWPAHPRLRDRSVDLQGEVRHR